MSSKDRVDLNTNDCLEKMGHLVEETPKKTAEPMSEIDSMATKLQEVESLSGKPMPEQKRNAETVVEAVMNNADKVMHMAAATAEKVINKADKLADDAVKTVTKPLNKDIRKLANKIQDVERLSGRSNNNNISNNNISQHAGSSVTKSTKAA